MNTREVLPFGGKIEFDYICALKLAPAPPPFAGQLQQHHQQRQHSSKLSPNPVAVALATEREAQEAALAHPVACPLGKPPCRWAPLRGMRQLLQLGAGAGRRGSCPRRRGALKKRKK